MYLKNLGCIELNPWNSRIKKLDYPDYMVMDLDPSDKNTFAQVVEVARAVKEIMDKAGADCFCKTSGATGLHVYIPMGAKYTYEQVREFANYIALLVHEQLPRLTTLERSLSKRKKNQLYLDYLQNKRGQTLACAYSLRPREGATVSAPLDWKEVKPGLDPRDFTIRNMLGRIEKKGDLFKGVLGKGIDMRKALKRLGG
jgi:bifunctional non-homologous end joining protein LigD